MHRALFVHLQHFSQRPPSPVENGSQKSRAAMNVSVCELSITVAGNRKLLSDVNCLVQAGEMVALMGPSGAGKTTLLNCIVGRSITGVTEGNVFYDGTSLGKVRSSVGYVTQDDIMYETLTPRENLWFASAFILPKLSKDTRNSVIEGVIEKLNLKKCADTVVGSPGLVRGISGGERKRTNVALSLLGNPSLLLLDEPTSGLDSKMSDSLMRDVKQIGQQGCTVVATIHQPSEAVFTRFDKVLLLETGKIAYYGPVASLRSSLSSLGFACPTGTPLPELLLDVLEVPKEEEEISSYRNKLEKLKQMSDTAKGDHGSPTKSEAPVKRAGPCGQLVTLFKRELVNVKRNKALTVVRAVQSVASSVLIGLIFLQLERNMSSLQPRLFSSFLLVFAQFLFAMLGVVNAFPAERAVFLRETQDKLYHPAMFYFAKVSIDTIMQCLFPILVVAISYPLIGLNGESADRILWFYTIMAVVSNCGAAVGFAVSAAVPSVNLALSIAPGLVMPQLLLAGIFIKVEDLPQPFNAISYLMVARYAVQATVVNEFSCTTKDACSPLVWRNASADLCDSSPCDFCCTAHEMMGAGGICPVLSCDDALVTLGMDEIWPIGDTHEDTIFYNFIALLCLMVFFRLQGLNVLLMSFRKATTGSCLPCKRSTPMGCVGARPGGPSHAEFTSAMWCPLHFCNFGVEVRLCLPEPAPRFFGRLTARGCTMYTFCNVEGVPETADSTDVLQSVRLFRQNMGWVPRNPPAGRAFFQWQLRLGGWFISYENGKAAVSVTHAKWGRRRIRSVPGQVVVSTTGGPSDASGGILFRMPDSPEDLRGTQLWKAKSGRGSAKLRSRFQVLAQLAPITWPFAHVSTRERSIFRMALRCWAIAGLVSFTESCTNLIVSPGASADGSTLFSYTADSGSVYGTLGHYPAGQHSAGAKRPVWDWDSGKYLGEIDEAPYTYNVIGNLNEHGLAIGETTFGGNETLSGGEGVMDYGSLIWVTLQRCKTAREAILMFDQLVKEYGYVSEGESFTIADAKEVWVLEMIGKGKFEKGAVWVAVRIPDGHVSGHANQARIQRFPLHDAENCVFSSDVISFAVKVGLWDAQRPQEEFSFADAYDPISFTGARLSDARVWSFFSSVALDPSFEKSYEKYVLGQNVSAAARMPLSIPVKSKISNVELMSHMRNHYEGTALDSRLDVGAGSSGSPFRVRPLVWKQGNASYVHERMVGTPQAGWNFVAQLRGWLPGPMAGLLWFGVDDASFSVHAPFHGGTTRVPQGYADGFGDALHYSRSAFWAFNTVANFIYPRWFLADAVMHRARMSEQTFVAEVQAEELLAKALYKKDPAKAIELLTARDVARAERVVEEEFALFGDLMVGYRDGFRISSQGPEAPDHGGQQGGVVPKVEEVGYSETWYDRIVKDTGEHYKIPSSSQLDRAKLRTLSKGVAMGMDTGSAKYVIV
ncbi:unnamed protein product [Durusdinium trenchii]|uniref:ABC transporter domain-containing protein n=1 Tax=Durusdinium trenchii TaxID=1381693 RepID=A0ABP0IET7_9DINO